MTGTSGSPAHRARRGHVEGRARAERRVAGGIAAPRARRLLLAASFAVPILIAATLGFVAVRGRAAVVQLSLLAFTAGILIAVAMEEMIPEAHEGGKPRLGPLALVCGVALFALPTVCVGD